MNSIVNVSTDPSLHKASSANPSLDTLFCSEKISQILIARYQRMNAEEMYQHRMNIAFAWWRSWIVLNKQYIPYPPCKEVAVTYPTSTKLARCFLRACAPNLTYTHANPLLLQARDEPSLFLKKQLSCMNSVQQDLTIQEMCLFLYRDMGGSHNMPIQAWGLHQLYTHFPHSVASFCKRCGVSMCDPSSLYLSESLTKKFWSLLIQYHTPFNTEEQDQLNCHFDQKMNIDLFRYTTIFKQKLSKQPYWAEKPFEVFAKAFYTTTEHEDVNPMNLQYDFKERGACLFALLHAYPQIKLSPLYSILLGKEISWIVTLPSTRPSPPAITPPFADQEWTQLLSEYHNVRTTHHHIKRLLFQRPPYTQNRILQYSKSFYNYLCFYKKNKKVNYPARVDLKILEMTLYFIITDPLVDTTTITPELSTPPQPCLRMQKCVRLHVIRRLSAVYSELGRSPFVQLLQQFMRANSSRELATCYVTYNTLIAENRTQPDVPEIDDIMLLSLSIASSSQKPKTSLKMWLKILGFVHRERLHTHPMQTVLFAFCPHAFNDLLLQERTHALYECMISQNRRATINPIEQNEFVLEGALYLLITKTFMTNPQETQTVQQRWKQKKRRLTEIKLFFEAYPLAKNSWLCLFITKLMLNIKEITKTNVGYMIKEMHTKYAAHISTYQYINEQETLDFDDLLQIFTDL